MSYQILRDCLRTYQAFVKTTRSTYFSNLNNSNVGRPNIFSTINKIFNNNNNILNPIATTFPEVSPVVCNDFFSFLLLRFKIFVLLSQTLEIYILLVNVTF